MSDRVILHCDCNSFFASVETALDPSYRGVPMAVCGSVEDRRGIVLAKNEEAKRFGIQTAETVFSAKKKCPTLVIAEPHHGEYVKYSRRVNEIYARYTDIIEPFGIDESWLDVTGSTKLFGSGYQIAESIRRAVREEIGITVSIGVSFNKVFAKLGSDYKKPDAVTEINRENFKDIVYPLSVSDLLFVGRKTENLLLNLGIRTIGELANASRELLAAKLGKAGEQLHRYALGLDDSPVVRTEDREDAKSVGSGFTFRHNLVNYDECRVGVEYLSEDIATRLRKLGMKCATVQLSIKDELLRVIQRQKPQNPPTDISREISKTALEILKSEWNDSRPIRMITVTASSLTPYGTSTEQISFFDGDAEKKRQNNKKREETIDKIRQKYGMTAIINGAVMESDIGVFDKKQKK